MADFSQLTDLQLLEALRQVRDQLERLEQANRGFLQSSDRLNDLQVLLDQRDLTLEMIREIEEALFSIFSPETSPRPGTLSEILFEAKKKGQIPAADWEPFLRVLEDFQRSNQEIETFLQEEKDKLSADLKTVRKGSSVLKGYAPPGSSGSCFIDKIK